MRIIYASVNRHYMVCACLILLNSSNLSKVTRVTDGLQSRLDQLEILYSEQDYMIQSLNDLVAQQDREISRLNLSLERLSQQLLALRSELADNIDSGPEQPPHY